MRLALLSLVVLVGCGHHHHADPHPVDARFDRLVGAWSASSFAATGDYASIPDATAGAFTVDDRGHLVGLDSLGGSIDLYLSPIGTDQFSGAHRRAGGATETVWIFLTPVEPTSIATVDDGPLSQVGWHLTPVSAPG